ncbi:MAG: SWIM zinc finger family protein [Desulfobulbaceae bacterium]
MRYWGFPEYETVAEKKAKAAKKLEQLKKKMPGIAPVVIEGNTLARTWWGKSWNRNLERYADYSNRIGRGKSYVRHGAVLDLRIKGGQVTALVQGTRAKPYEIVIRITPIKKANWDHIRKQCQGELRSLPDLLAGKFPKELGDIFLAEGKGLFPTPKEISFDCSCPDWASMCKHVAATLYGIGARLDEDPLLFFTLRQADTEELVAQAVQAKTGDLLAKADKRSSRVIDDADLSGLFGIDMDVKPDFSGVAKLRAARRPPRGKEAPASEQAIGTMERTATTVIEEIVRKSRKGVTVAMLEEATGFPRAKIYAITSRLRQQDRIRYVAQGVYGRP